MRYNAPGRHRANTFDEAAAQVFLQARKRCRLGFLRLDHLELLAIFGMVAPVPHQAQGLPGMDVRKAAYDGHEVAYPWCFEPGHRVTGILGVIGHALYDALHVLCRMRLVFTR